MDLATNPLTPHHRLRKLRTMPASEMAYRGWQEASKLLSRWTAGDRPIDPAKWLRSRAPLLAGQQAALGVVRDQAPQRFFAGVTNSNIATELESAFPGAAEDIIAKANALLAGRFDLLGYESLSFGDPIDWHLDPVAGRRAPMAHWSLIDPLDPESVGDSKVIWELNRHQWLIRLAQAWTLSGDLRYADACVRAIDAWRDANPCGMGINWASSLEVSYRLMSWCWTAMLIRNAPAVTGEWAQSLLVSIWQHANHVRQYLSYYFSPNTHLTGEALGLVYAGTLFPEFRDAAEWQALGTRVLIDESRAQISSDGVHFEQSTYYHGYTLETYLQFIQLAARNGIEIPAAVPARTEQLVDFLIAMRRPDGTMPSIGDSDGGALLPLVERRRGDSRGVFAIAAAMFGRSDFAWAAAGAGPELAWMIGADGIAAFNAIEPAAPSTAPSRAFVEGGYAIMRTGWDREAHQLIVDAGPIGCPASSGHGHADLLSVQLSIFGEPCLVDAGTYCYTPQPEWRRFFRGTRAHSTITIDGLDQAESAGPFKWNEKPAARVVSWSSDAERDRFVGEHDAYQRLPQPVKCRRSVTFEKPEYFLIADEIEGSGHHQIELTFQFAPHTRVAIEQDGSVRVETPRGRALWMSCRATSPMQPHLAVGDEHPIRGWVSRDYGVREPAPAVVFAGAASLPVRIVTLLLPIAES